MYLEILMRSVVDKLCCYWIFSRYKKSTQISYLTLVTYASQKHTMWNLKHAVLLILVLASTELC